MTLTLKDLDKEDEVPLVPLPLEVIIPMHRQDLENKKYRDNYKSDLLYHQFGMFFPYL
jgi:U6 snRNA-associated Sm-like protein LSm1